jgi:CheY-like chemotaxis protein
LISVLFPDLVSRKDTAPKTDSSAAHHEAGEFRILVVDDVIPNQLLVKKILESLGYSVSVAANGLEAIEMLAHVPCDLVLMDCQMPEMDGFEATRQIRNPKNVVSRDIPVIALTANALSGDDKKCFDAGMNDYLTKPLKKMALVEKLNLWLPNSLMRKNKSA